MTSRGCSRIPSVCANVISSVSSKVAALCVFVRVYCVTVVFLVNNIVPQITVFVKLLQNKPVPSFCRCAEMGFIVGGHRTSDSDKARFAFERG